MDVYQIIGRTLVLKDGETYCVRMAGSRMGLGPVAFKFLHKLDKDIPLDSQDSGLTEDDVVMLAMRVERALIKQEAGKRKK